MQTRQQTFTWNELDFLDWEEFRQMGPPIVKLEIQRIERLLAHNELDEGVRDGLLRARLELVRFVAELEGPSAAQQLNIMSEHLRRAAFNVGIHAEQGSEDENGQIRYIADRLGYIHNRMGLIY